MLYDSSTRRRRADIASAAILQVLLLKSLLENYVADTLIYGSTSIPECFISLDMILALSNDIPITK